MRTPAGLALIVLTGCWLPAREAASRDFPPEPPGEIPAGQAGVAPEPAPAGPATGAISEQDRKIAFRGSLTIQVTRPDEAESRIREIAEAAKGWIHELRGDRITIRVPAPAFHRTMAKLAAIGRVLDRSISGSDVTEEYLDLEIRIRNAEEMLRRLHDLLQKAQDVRQALEVEREIQRITAELERMKGRLRMLRDMVAYSTIVVELRQTIPPHLAPPTPEYPFPWIRSLGLEALFRFR